MLQRVLGNRTLPCLSNLVRLGCANKFSTASSKDGDNPPDVENKSTRDTSEKSSEGVSKSEELKQLLDDAASYRDVNDKSWATHPYPVDAPIFRQKEPEKQYDKPMDNSVMIFPGQGIIRVGQIKQYLRFPNVKNLFEIANEILNYDLLKICLKGPQSLLDTTRYNQPATVLLSLAALERLREERPRVFENCMAAAGYSVGELTALIFAGVMSLEDGIRLVATRASAMQYAADQVPQGMLSVYCTAEAQTFKACQEAIEWASGQGVNNPICQVAIYLFTQTKILAGNEETLKFIEKHSKTYGLTKVKRLPVSGAFHTPLMAPALKAFKKCLLEITLDEPRCKVYSNCKVVPYTQRQAPAFLVKQIVAPVKWEQSMQRIYSRREGIPFPRSFDVGSGGRMKTILNLINEKAAHHCIVA